MMKKTLMKIGMIAAFLFCSNLTHRGISDHFIRPISILTQQIIRDLNINSKAIHLSRFAPMYALQKDENLRAYHYGLKFFNPFHKITTAHDLIYSVRSHPFFISNESRTADISLQTKATQPFFLFETCQKDKSIFYIVHCKGIRHFTINTSNEKWKYMASLDNGVGKNYPNLKAFIQCTLNLYSEKHLYRNEFKNWIFG